MKSYWLIKYIFRENRCNVKKRQRKTELLVSMNVAQKYIIEVKVLPTSQ